MDQCFDDLCAPGKVQQASNIDYGKEREQVSFSRLRAKNDYTTL